MDSNKEFIQLLARAHGMLHGLLKRLSKGRLLSVGETKDLSEQLLVDQQLTANALQCGVNDLTDILSRKDLVRPRVCFVDLDGVLANFVGGALKAHGCDPNMPLVPGKWDVAPQLGLSQREFWQKCNSIRFWAELEPTPDGESILQSVERLFGIKNVYLLTAPADAPESYAGKKIWVDRYLPDYSGRLIMTSHKRLLANPWSVLVDDSDANCQSFVTCGGYAVIVPRVWNSRHELANQTAVQVQMALSQLFV